MYHYDDSTIFRNYTKQNLHYTYPFLLYNIYQNYKLYFKKKLFFYYKFSDNAQLKFKREGIREITT